MTATRRTTLGAICADGGGFIRTGPFGSQLHQSDYVDDPNGIPVVMPKDMVGGRINLSTIARIDRKTAARLSHHLLAAGDIVLSRRGDVGRTVWVSEDDLPVLCGTGSMRIHPGAGGPAYDEYLRYFMRSRLAIDYLEGQAVGATMPNLNAGIVAGLPVTLPPLEEQRVVAEILSSIDDLIRSTQGRIELLDRMTQAIYREWFVQYRYPGHENFAYVGSPLGPIPEGWQVTSIGGVLELRYGKALKAADRKGGHVAVVGSSEVVGWHDEELTPGPAIVVGRKGNVGNVIWVPGPCWPIDTTYYVATELPLPYVAEQLKRAEFINSHAAVPGLSRTQAYSLPFLLPPENAMSVFAEVSGAFGGQVHTLLQQIDRLGTIRDLLLPRLVSGEIDVSTLDLDALVASVA